MRPSWNRRLAPVVHPYLELPKHKVAVLLGEDGHLDVRLHENDPNFIDDVLNLKDEVTGIVRILTYRYVKTDLLCQSGHRIYVLNEIISNDLPFDLWKYRAKAKAKKKPPTRAAADAPAAASGD